MNKRVAILISGRGSNMESLLVKSFEEKLQIDFLVISDNPDAEGLKKAEKFDVKTKVLKNLKKGWKIEDEGEVELLEILEDFSPDLILLAGFMRIIPIKIVEKYYLKIVNIHPSLLPSFKGKDAQKQAFEYGVKISGCTVHFVDRGVDTGPIIAQMCVDISDAKSVEDVSKKILEKEHQLYFEVMKKLLFSKWKVENRNVYFC
ncbi:MAG: phosphoribosylglycinamide formyltransferase [candidate division WOR-3 bacterium]